ncbi:MAG: hypothetical protein R3B40_19055 [Polyangiales bacterium]|nr:hypothetical protein [Myxococcales bacterium]MCB9657822.1 hypothetical protein [Sandaracinaceae bacterium]
MTLQLGFDFGASDTSPLVPRAGVRDRAVEPPSALAVADPTSDRTPDVPAGRSTSAPMPFLLRSSDQALSRAGQLSAHIASSLREPVRVAFTDNRRTMLSARRRGGKLEVRLHHMFLEADEATLDAIGAYLGHADRRASMRIDSFIAARHDVIRGSQRRNTHIRVEGEVHDLVAMMDDIVDRHFGGATEARITWGRRVAGVHRGRRRKSIQLGTYSADERLIRIHPVLDQEWVPDFYVESVIFHELLHHELGAEEKDGRRCFHTPEFRRRERAFECFARAQVWEKENLSRLLRGH